MRILVVSNLYPPVVRGGYEVECSGVVERLRERHEVMVLTSTLDRPDDDPEGVRRELAFLPPNERGAVRAPLAALSAARVTRRLLADERPDLVFVWNGAQIPQTALRIIADSGIPTAYRVCEHWFGRLFVEDQYLRHLRPGDRGLRLVWAAGTRLLNHLPALRLAPDRVTPAAISWNSETIRRLAGVPPAVDPVFERVIHSTSIRGPLFETITREPSPSPLVAFLGRLDERKGAWVAVRAVGKLRAVHGTAARLVLAGPSTPREREELRSEIAAAGVDDLVEIVGALSPTEVAELLARATILVIPSVWQDPFPLVCIEGGLARVPIVASEVGGIPECLHDSEHALLFPPGDVEACASALHATLTDEAATGARVARALVRAKEFSWDGYLDASEQFVEDAFAALSR